MDLISISEITRMFNITVRMLRYYDSIGLLPSARPQGYAYRMYNERDVRRLVRIIALRKLRIPLKTIMSVVDGEDLNGIIEAFQRKSEELEDDIAAARMIRDILRGILSRLNADQRHPVATGAFDDAEITTVMRTLSLSKINFREDISMDDLTKANDTLSTLKNARILYLPPATVASSYYFGAEPEENAGKAMDDFVINTRLHFLKPDLRLYGFNNPSPQSNETYGYEFWVTIPDDMKVPSPLLKKSFPGGLYAAHCIRMGDFHEWQYLDKWVKDNPEYEYDTREPFGMGGCLEEHLNAFSYFSDSAKAPGFIQLDLLAPIKRKDIGA